MRAQVDFNDLIGDRLTVPYDDVEVLNTADLKTGQAVSLYDGDTGAGHRVLAYIVAVEPGSRVFDVVVDWPTWRSSRVRGVRMHGFAATPRRTVLDFGQPVPARS